MLHKSSRLHKFVSTDRQDNTCATRECPVGAIDVADPKNTILEKCISCLRCIGICPKGARNVDQNLWNMMAQKMAPVLGGRKENHLFL